MERVLGGVQQDSTRETISRIYCYIHTLITKNKHYSNNIVINIILCNNRIVYQL